MWLKIPFILFYYNFFYILVSIGEKLHSQKHNSKTCFCEQNNNLIQNNKNVLHLFSINFSLHIIILLNKSSSISLNLAIHIKRVIL